jgi:hypothetical protein
MAESEVDPLHNNFLTHTHNARISVCFSTGCCAVCVCVCVCVLLYISTRLAPLEGKLLFPLLLKSYFSLFVGIKSTTFFVTLPFFQVVLLQFAPAKDFQQRKMLSFLLPICVYYMHEI